VAEAIENMKGKIQAQFPHIERIYTEEVEHSRVK